jgi:hypothetical protein
MRSWGLTTFSLAAIGAAISPAQQGRDENNAYSDDDYLVASRDDGIRLRRVHHRHLYKKDGHHELFEPRAEMQLDVLMGMYALAPLCR